MSKMRKVTGFVFAAGLTIACITPPTLAAIYFEYDGYAAPVEVESIEWAEGEPDEITLKRGVSAGVGELTINRYMDKASVGIKEACKDQRKFKTFRFEIDGADGQSRSYNALDGHFCGCDFQEVGGLNIKSKRKKETLSFCYQKITWD